MSIPYNIRDIIHNASWSQEEKTKKKIRKLDYRELFLFAKTALKNWEENNKNSKYRK